MNTVELLNAAFESDPNAIHSLICSRIPCNQKLADDPFIIVDIPPVLGDDEHFQVGMMGVINGILAANNLPIVATKFGEADADGRRKLLGFVEYNSD